MSGGTVDTTIAIGINININITTKRTYNHQKEAAIVTAIIIEEESCNQEQWGKWVINPPHIRQEELMEVALAITITTITVTIHTNLHRPRRIRR
ncbi:MAG: hypothetical protein ACI90V_011200 [Bacillariaceae sp.]|jgi:hypothetical protein